MICELHQLNVLVTLVIVESIPIMIPRFVLLVRVEDMNLAVFAYQPKSKANLLANPPTWPEFVISITNSQKEENNISNTS